MQNLRPDTDSERFFASLAARPRAVLLLDYDGTLAPFHVELQEARPYPGVREALDRLMAQDDTRVVIVSGRWSRDLPPLLGLRRVPEIWGSHGWERRHPDGRTEMPRPAARALRGLLDVDDWIGEVHARGGRVELKPACLAIHWRGLDESAANEIGALVRHYWARHQRDAGLELHPFDAGLELRVPGRNKGDAVRTLRAEEPDAALAYLGDDQTDEDAFAALGGDDLGVLVRGPPRPTRAALQLAPPEELLAFLRRWTDIREAHRAAARA